MRNRIIQFLVCFLLVTAAFPTSALAAKNTEEIIILYENDAHCALEGYSKLAAMKTQLQESYAYVGAVSGGDYIRGNSLGAISKGKYIIDVMNLVGYDAVTLGNHEFGYRLGRLDELTDMMVTRPVCCNFQKIGSDEPYFEPYSMVSYGDTDIAYVGITTPSTLTMAFPAQFRDDSGEYIYTFHPTDLYDVVQEQIDSARAAGADYVIALSHIGFADEAEVEDVVDLIRNTEGFDVVLDAHSHSVIEGEHIPDKSGKNVLLSSAGTKFEYIGKLTVSRDGFTSELIRTEELEATDPAVDACIQQIYEEYAQLGERIVAFSEVDLITQDENGDRLVRRAETNLGDLCAEAFRSAVDADIGYINGGGIRADIAAGDITFNDLLSVLPFDNTVVLAEVTGQVIRDMMEMAMMSWPEENGSFPHLSGLTFSVNTEIPTSVVLNETEEFAGVSGAYRVYDIEVLNRETGKYEPLELTDTYTIASHNYALLEQGSGMSMLENARILQNDGTLDIEAFERYIVEDLNGLVSEDYRDAVPNITFTQGERELPAAVSAVIVGAAAVVLILLVIRAVLRRRAGKK